MTTNSIQIKKFIKEKYNTNANVRKGTGTATGWFYIKIDEKDYSNINIEKLQKDIQSNFNIYTFYSETLGDLPCLSITRK